jgi:hypothetical protein
MGYDDDAASVASGRCGVCARSVVPQCVGVGVGVRVRVRVGDMGGKEGACSLGYDSRPTRSLDLSFNLRPVTSRTLLSHLHNFNYITLIMPIRYNSIEHHFFATALLAVQLDGDVTPMSESATLDSLHELQDGSE